MHVLTVIRSYLGMSQCALARAAGITQPDLSEIETMAPYGKLDKFQRLSQYLGLPLEAIVKNDFTRIPDSFFDKHHVPVYAPAPTTPELLLGRKGEEYIFQREQSRLAEIYPALSRLILPIYKMKGPSPGYDVLSFDDSGKPFVIEVKTSAYNTNCFRLTNNELRAATQMTEAGEKYVICYISNWGLPQQDIQEYTFGSLHQTHRMDPLYYMCRPLAQRGPRTVTGLAYFRQKRGFRQGDFAALMGINASKWNVYEGGHHRPPIKVYIRASELLDVTLDELVEEYEVEAANG